MKNTQNRKIGLIGIWIGFMQNCVEKLAKFDRVNNIRNRYLSIASSSLWSLFQHTANCW